MNQLGFELDVTAGQPSLESLMEQYAAMQDELAPAIERMNSVKSEIASLARNKLTNGDNIRHAGVLVTRAKGFKKLFLSSESLKELQDVEAVRALTVTKQQAPSIRVSYTPR